MKKSMTHLFQLQELILPPTSDAWRPLLESYHNEFCIRMRSSLSFSDPEDVRLARTRGRRLITAMDVMTPVAPSNLPLGPQDVAAEIKQLMDLLSKPRDLDVLIPLVTAWRNVLRKSPLSKLLKRFITFMEGRRDKARARMTARLPGLFDESYIPRWEHFSETPMDACLQNIDVAQLLKRLQADSRTSLGQFQQVRGVLGLTHPETLRRLHAFRLTMKRVRYSLRLLQDFNPEQVAPAVEQAKVLQSHMGAINDIRVMRKQFGRFLDQSQKAIKGLESAVYLFDSALEARLQLSLRQLDPILLQSDSGHEVG